MKLSTTLSWVGQRAQDFSGAVVNLAVPNTCLACDTFVVRNGGFCAPCWARLRMIQSPICPVLGSPFSVDMGEHFLSAEAIANPPPFNRLRAVLLYDEMARRVISSIKYRDRVDLLPWAANWMHHAGKELLADADIILPVPLHSSRLRTRRFNQAAEIARCIAVLNDVEYAPHLLVRRKSTRQQVGLSEAQRERNVAGAFAVPEEMKIHLKDKHVLLVDDVYTTGATAKAVTRALLRAGCSNIDVLVLAKVETHPI